MGKKTLAYKILNVARYEALCSSPLSLNIDRFSGIAKTWLQPSPDGITHAGASEDAGYPRAISASFRRPALLPATLSCHWRRGSSGVPLLFGTPQAGVRFTQAKPTEFVVASEATGKPLVVGCLGQGVLAPLEQGEH